MGAMAFEGKKAVHGFVNKYNIDCDLKACGIFATYNEK
jgi:gamma-glutamylputrescine oxidase